MSTSLTRTPRSSSLPRSPSLHPPLRPPSTRSASSPLPTAVSPAPENTESVLNHYVYGPLLFASFLLSFLLIDNRNHNRTAGNHGRSGDEKDQKPWIWRTKHRKLARLEIGQALGAALDMRRWVVLVVVGGMGVGFVGFWWAGMWVYGVVGKVVGLG